MKIVSFDVGIKNLSFCIVDEKEKIIKWENINLSDSPIRGDKQIALICELDNRPCLLDADIILIEKQPRFNPTMRVMGGCIKTYFLMRGVIDNSKKMKVLEYSPKHKLQCYEGPKVEVTGCNQYVKNKKLSIIYCRKMIIYEDQKFIDLFNVSKKKDDLADSYLQGISYLRYSLQKKTGKIVARKPTKRQIKYHKFSKSNLKYLGLEIINKPVVKDISHFFGQVEKTKKELLGEWIESDKWIKKNIHKNYDSLELYMKDLNL